MPIVFDLISHAYTNLKLLLDESGVNMLEVKNTPFLFIF